MSAALKREPNREEHTTMPSNDSDDLREQVARLSSDVRHIQADVTDIKTDQHVSRIWAFGLYVSLLFILAKGFKWL
jgi:hypothetical protein